MKRLSMVGLLLMVALSVQAGRNELHAAADEVQPLLPGMQVPAFTLRTVSGQAFEFTPGKLAKPLVITFFRGGWCPYCNLHLAEMRHTEKALLEMGFDVWFISPDKPELLYASLDEPDIGYTLFSDSQLAAARAFGIAFKLDAKTLERYTGYGIDLAKASGESHYGLPAPSTFILSQNGRVSFQYTNPDYAVRLHPDVLLAAARSLKTEHDRRFKKKR